MAAEAKRPQRSVSLVKRIGDWFLLAIAEGRHVTWYIGHELRTGVIELERQDDAGTAATYRVRPDKPHCSCKGFRYAGHCRHASALQALCKAGKLAA